MHNHRMQRSGGGKVLPMGAQLPPPADAGRYTAGKMRRIEHRTLEKNR